MPKLTLGGTLLAKRRLETLHDRLTPDRSHVLSRIGQELALQKSQWGVRYRNKLLRDLRGRLDAWAWYLDDCQSQGESASVFYTRQVETLVKADLLLEELAEVELNVEGSQQRSSALDERLRANFSPGDFCWPAPLATGFANDRFWYLWGRLTKPAWMLQ